MSDFENFRAGGPQIDNRSFVPGLAMAAAKSPLMATLLGLFFGPIGLIYVTIKGAIIMFLVNIVVGSLTLGFGLFLTWPICALWGYIAAQKHNERIALLAASAVQ